MVGGLVLRSVPAAGVIALVVTAQATLSPGAASPDPLAATRAKVTALRDQYVATLKADGFTCPLPPPAIVI